jgi:hypothetical protein
MLIVKFIVIIFVITIVVLVNVFQNQIIHALEPAAVWIYRYVEAVHLSAKPHRDGPRTPAAWLIPIAILVVLSIPPVRRNPLVRK